MTLTLTLPVTDLEERLGQQSEDGQTVGAGADGLELGERPVVRAVEPHYHDHVAEKEEK
jgi:hypothetical protein